MNASVPNLDRNPRGMHVLVIADQHFHAAACPLRQPYSQFLLHVADVLQHDCAVRNPEDNVRQSKSELEWCIQLHTAKAAKAKEKATEKAA